MTKNLSTYTSGMCLAFLTACGGGGSNDNNNNGPATPEPQAATPERQGTITVQRFQDGKPVSWAEMEAQAKKNNPEPFYSYLKQREFVTSLSSQKVPFVLAALNGYTIGVGYSVGHVYTPYKTQNTEYINAQTGQYYTYDQFAAGVQDPNGRRISLASHWGGSMDHSHYYGDLTRMKVFLHESCHAVDTMLKMESVRDEVVKHYLAAIAQARYDNRLDQIPGYFRLTSDGGLQNNAEAASREAFAEICSEGLYNRMWRGGPLRVNSALNVPGYPDLNPLMGEFSKHVWKILEGLEKEYSGKKYSYILQGGPGAEPKTLTFSPQ